MTTVDEPLYKHRTKYFRKAFEDLGEIASRLDYALVDVECDTLIGTGLSGALVVPTLARLMGKYWAIVRKPSDINHSDMPIEGEVGRKWVFVDDFVETGQTLQLVKYKIGREVPESHYEGTFEYQRTDRTLSYIYI